MQGASCLEEVSTAGLMRLLGAGASGAILMALGRGPLRTKRLTQQVPGYVPRSVYRYAAKLATLGVIEREEEPGVPSKVVYRLSRPCGGQLYELIEGFAGASLERLPDGRIDSRAWASLGSLADLWEAGMIEELSREACSPTQLARIPHGLSYHQVVRRVALFKADGMLREQPSRGRRHSYVLTEKARRKAILFLAIDRWRNDNVAVESREPLTAAEMATMLRVVLPLARAPRHAGRCVRLSVSDEDSGETKPGEIWARVEADGAVVASSPLESPSACARGRVEDWTALLLDSDSKRVFVDGEAEVVTEALGALHEVPSSSS